MKVGAVALGAAAIRRAVINAGSAFVAITALAKLTSARTLMVQHSYRTGSVAVVLDGVLVVEALGEELDAACLGACDHELRLMTRMRKT